MLCNLSVKLTLQALTLILPSALPSSVERLDTQNTAVLTATHACLSQSHSCWKHTLCSSTKSCQISDQPGGPKQLLSLTTYSKKAQQSVDFSLKADPVPGCRLFPCSAFRQQTNLGHLCNSCWRQSTTTTLMPQRSLHAFYHSALSVLTKHAVLLTSENGIVIVTIPAIENMTMAKTVIACT